MKRNLFLHRLLAEFYAENQNAVATPEDQHSTPRGSCTSGSSFYTHMLLNVITTLCAEI
ncbi:hypothetical protein SBV1_2890001 [Verrucomicrobia bacterium]|nr:hypothetical protein SBV1_2890001 [Verrucomicrobiota bacterium]